MQRPDVDVSGVVVTRYGYAVPAGRIRIIEAAHPVSDSMSEVAAMLIVEALRGLTSDDWCWRSFPVAGRR